MNKAKIKALEGGYVPNNKSDAEMLLDPLFFQALGKAEGWGWVTPCEFGDNENHVCKDCAKWLYEWHSFIDHITEGNPIDEFFNNLLK